MFLFHLPSCGDTFGDEPVQTSKQKTEGHPICYGSNHICNDLRCLGNLKFTSVTSVIAPTYLAQPDGLNLSHQVLFTGRALYTSNSVLEKVDNPLYHIPKYAHHSTIFYGNVLPIHQMVNHMVLVVKIHYPMMLLD